MEVAGKKPAAKKGSAAKKPAQHPAYKEMIVEALQTLHERNGSSRQKIYQYIVQNFKCSPEDDGVKRHMKLALKRMVTAGVIVQSKGVGASGSFKLPAAAKKAAVKKPVAKKPTKPVTKKPVKKAAATSKKSSAKSKTTAGKKAPAKSPKKPKSKVAKKPKSAKKSPAKTASKKSASKPKAKAAAKKPAAKSPKKSAKK